MTLAISSNTEYQRKKGRQPRNPGAECHYRSFLVEVENRKENFTRFGRKNSRNTT